MAGARGECDSKKEGLMTNIHKNQHGVKPDQPVRKSGWVRLERSMRYDPLWMKERKFSQFEAFLDLYMGASGIDRSITYKRKSFALKRGQLIVSQRELAGRWQWSRGSVENFLHKLVMRQTISNKIIKAKPRCTRITILKYNSLNPRPGGTEDLF